MKTSLKEPALILLYGFPGAGKTYFARNACQNLNAVHISDDRIRNKLFERPVYDRAENAIVTHLVDYLVEEFVKGGISVVLDVDARRTSYRKHFRDLAKSLKSQCLVAWFQVDPDTAFARLSQRDRRRAENKHAVQMTKQQFDTKVSTMQHPGTDENYVVLSGKHSFHMQYATLLRKLFDINLVTTEDVAKNVVKPGLTNLIPARRKGAPQSINIR